MKKKLWFLIIMVICIFSRIYQFGLVPGGVNQDEALAGYEAYCILQDGKDIHGYTYPVYLTAWGSGMNALNSYLMIPFIALFGLHTWVIRIPQVIVACLTVFCVYGIMKEITDEKNALFATFLLAVAPWHIMLARWGLESNLAPGFLTFGLYFFIKGLKKKQWFYVSACMYGLALYCYATIWPIVPVILCLQVGYCIGYKKVKLQKEIIISGIIVFVMAAPLILFMLVNNGTIEEIRLSFLSIPRLLYMRSGEISVKNIPDNFINLLKIIKNQQDGLLWNATEKYGICYHSTLVFFTLGLFFAIKETIYGIKKKEFSMVTLLLIQLCAAFLLGILVSVNINRINCLFVPMILTAAYGIGKLCDCTKPKAIWIFICFYLICFIYFEKYYFNEYKQQINVCFCEGLEDAVDRVQELEGKVYITPGASWARVLFLSEQSPEDFRKTVTYSNYPDAFLNAEKYGRFSTSFDVLLPEKDAVYLLEEPYDLSVLKKEGFCLEQYGPYTVAWYE